MSRAVHASLNLPAREVKSGKVQEELRQEGRDRVATLHRAHPLLLATRAMCAHYLAQRLRSAGVGGSGAPSLMSRCDRALLFSPESGQATSAHSCEA